MNIGRNILAVVVGFLAGSIVNMGIVMIGSLIIPPPAGADLATVGGVKAAISQMGPVHFVPPLLAHALGTLAGALVAAIIAASHKMKFAMVIGVLTLLGGIAAAYMIPAPLWFEALDLIIAYIPMAWLGGKLAGASRTPHFCAV
jgi:hypothetical protein